MHPMLKSLRNAFAVAALGAATSGCYYHAHFSTRAAPRHHSSLRDDSHYRQARQERLRAEARAEARARERARERERERERRAYHDGYRDAHRDRHDRIDRHDRRDRHHDRHDKKHDGRKRKGGFGFSFRTGR